MNCISDWIYHHKTKIIILLILCIGGIGSVFAASFENTKEEDTLISDVKTEEVEEQTKEEKLEKEPEIENKEEGKMKSWRIDIKGAITNPGVYEVEENTRIYEVISLAGGLLKDATTENINLSKKVSDEMVIFIFTKEEYQKKTTCNIKNDFTGEISEEIQKKESLIEQSKEKEATGKISLNKATKEELMTLEGIGEAKALSIIEYRTKNNGFQNIEELKNVSGIGVSLYENIKNNITL